MEEPLEIRVELLDARGEIERVVARAATAVVGRGAFEAAVTEYGARYGVRMRHGARVVEMRERAPAADAAAGG